MARVTYLPTLIKLTRGLCQAIFVATPIIRRLYPTNVALLAALEAANIACQALFEEAEAQNTIGD